MKRILVTFTALFLCRIAQAEPPESSISSSMIRGEAMLPATAARSTTPRTAINLPKDSAGKTFHLICEVTDDSVPNLTAYRRIIFAPVP
jgi:hypothetical protein